MAHWLPAAQSYFLPWHLDSLFVEHVVERGLVGLLIFLSLVMYAAWNMVFGPGSRLPFSPYLAASLFSVMVLGIASSVMDAPRVALLLYLVVFCSIQAAQANEAR
jgi:hypothetical protein